jgi:hypothetical protein
VYSLFLARMLVEQGGRCAYSGAPISPSGLAGASMASLERVKSWGHYSYTNVVLVSAGLNARTAGQCNPRMTQEELEASARRGGFSQTYWNLSTGVTPEVASAMALARNFDATRLRDLLKPTPLYSRATTQVLRAQMQVAGEMEADENLRQHERSDAVVERRILEKRMSADAMTRSKTS